MDTCKRGHPRTDQNTFSSINEYGTRKSGCKVCKRLLRNPPSKTKRLISPKEICTEDLTEQVEMIKQPKRLCRNCGKPNTPNRYYNCETCVTLESDTTDYGIY